MRITPQAVLDSIDRYRRDGLQPFRPAELSASIRILEQAVLFTFPDPGEIAEHCAFAIDLYERGLFRLPFPTTAVAFERDLGPPHGIRGGMFVLIMDDAQRISCISCSEVDDPGRYAIPVGIVLRAKVAKAGPREGTIQEEVSAAVVTDRIASAMFGAGPAGREKMRGRLLNNTVNAMALIVMLMSKGVTTTAVTPSDKLNKARLKRGKPALRESYVVAIDAGRSHVISHDDGSESDITGHTRGSPRMHWRRGHFRTLARGTDAERVVPVAPALVAANEMADAVRAKAYEVRP